MAKKKITRRPKTKRRRTAVPTHTPVNPGPIWRTKDGRAVPIAQMTDDHLLNTIRLLRTKAPLLRHRLAHTFTNDALRGNDPSGDTHDTLAPRQAFENACFATFATDDALLSCAVHAWPHLQAERKRRKLKELPHGDLAFTVKPDAGPDND